MFFPDGGVFLLLDKTSIIVIGESCKTIVIECALEVVIGLFFDVGLFYIGWLCLEG